MAPSLDLIRLSATILLKQSTRTEYTFSGCLKFLEKRRQITTHQSVEEFPQRFLHAVEMESGVFSLMKYHLEERLVLLDDHNTGHQLKGTLLSKQDFPAVRKGNGRIGSLVSNAESGEYVKAKITGENRTATSC